MRASLLGQCLFAFVLLAAEVCFAQAIQLQPGSILSAGGATLDVGDQAIPCVSDWNGDGLRDLLVGNRPADKIAVFYNSGTGSAPVFTTSSNLQAGGADIYHASSACGAPAPFACDFDADGKRDLLVGTGVEGNVFFYRNTNTDAVPVLAPGVPLMVGTNRLAVAARATPYVYDWDGDGLNDLLCGDGNGTASFFKNIGTALTPAFAAGLAVQAGGSPLNLGIRSAVRMCDWDGDGIRDLVGSSSYGVFLCKNVGSDAAPVLLPPTAVRAPVATSGLQSIYTGYRMRLELADWNDDGIMDLLVGNADGTISYYEGYSFLISRTSPVNAGECILQWASAPFLRYQVLGGTSPGSITNLLAVDLHSAGRATAWTNPAPVSPSFYRLQVAP